MTDPPAPPPDAVPPIPPPASPATARTKRGLFSRTLGLTRGVLLAGMALLMAVAVLLVLLTREVPDLETVATDLVTPIASAANLGQNAEQVAEQVVAQVDDTLLGNAIEIADTVRVAVRFLPAVPGLVIVIIWSLTPGRWRRRKAIGGTAAGFGLFLLVYTWGLERLAHVGLSRLPSQVAAVGEDYVDELLATAWIVCWVTLIAGAALWAYARFRLSDPETT